ncbi:hypothetical protein LPB03_01005 [Polaribacter vadi]|uniref:Uncharacterized protein n=1 Tax=Polaribacter vadi TaxID=1774273 RepID=A0A1B8U106_9FLAO|nr:hypothetical protein [Polaribacter vadi]AOW16123.1 hypothetical protein LPB03_01005 [Polaribacter vadi]OBY65551.1 hypothetical protein LPB3_04105 [Polaribacter vadi]
MSLNLNQKNNFKIDFSIFYKIEKENYVSYTFLIERNSEETSSKASENLVIEKSNDTIKGFIIRYDSVFYRKKGSGLYLNATVSKTAYKYNIEELINNQNIQLKGGWSCSNTTTYTPKVCTDHGSFSTNPNCEHVRSGYWNVSTIRTCSYSSENSLVAETELDFGSEAGGGRRGGSSGSGETVSIIPCDGESDGLEQGIDGGCFDIIEEDELIDDDQIINELTGKALCVYNKMVDNNNNINWILENFKDGNKPSKFDLIFEMSTSLGNETNASTVKSGNTFTISINENTLSNRTSLGLARTIIHEGIHARLREFASRDGSNAVKFPGVYNYFRIYKKNWDHQQMADYYRSTIAKGLKQYDNSQHSDQFYNDMSWEGLANIKDANGVQDQIYTEAWKKLTTPEKNRIKNTITNEKDNVNKTCQ